MTKVQTLCVFLVSLASQCGNINAHHHIGMPVASVPLVQGHWGEWQAWASCSATCGIGTRHRTRSCVYPPPHLDGLQCDGAFDGAGTGAEPCLVETCPHETVQPGNSVNFNSMSTGTGSTEGCLGVIEASSGNTYLRYYKYTINTNDPNLFTDLHEESSIHVSPGIHRFKDGLRFNDVTVRQYLQPLMDAVDAKHEEHGDGDHARHLLFLATGEIRLLLVDESEPILEEVRNLLKNETFNKKFIYSGDNSVKVISGEEQAAYNWVALNYLAGNLQSDTEGTLSLPTSYGIFAMGPESTQIAFVPESPPKAGEFTVTLGGVKYELYVHSYEQYGSRGMIDLMAEDFARWGITNATETDVAQIANPCFNRGYDQRRGLANGTTVEHVGTGDAMACVKTIQSHLYTDIQTEIDMQLCTEKPCRVRNVYQPDLPANMTFYATHRFVNVARDMDMKVGREMGGYILDEDNLLNVTRLLGEGFQFCEKNTTTAMLEYPRVVENLVGRRCLGALYTPSLLLAYGVNDGQNVPVVARSALHSQRIDWALGAAVVNTYEQLLGVQVMGSYSYSAVQQTDYVHNIHDIRYGPLYAYGHRDIEVGR